MRQTKNRKMKKSMNCLLGVLSLWCVSNQGANAQINKLQDYENKKSATIGSFQGITFKEGGFSGLFAIPNTNGKEFWTVSDRGVNVDAANANTPSCKPTYDKIYAFPNYAPKIHRIKIQGDSVQILQTITIKRPNGTTATGIINPTGFGSTSVEVASTDTVQNCANFNNKIANKDVWGIDSEGITVDKDGNFWLCEEGGPTIWKVDKNGVVLKRYTPYATKVGAESQDVAIDTVFAYRKNNRGFEGITITPNGKVYAIIQSPILFPSKAVGEGTKIHRILEIDPTNNTSKMYAYLNEGIIGTSGANQIRLRDWKIGDLTAINDTTFLVLEAALRGTNDIKKMYKININGATPVLSGISYDNNTKSLESLVNETGLANNNIIPVKKTLYMDLLANGWPALLEKAEGLTIVNDSTIAIANDNDYGQYSPTENGVATATGLNCHVYTYGLSGTDKLTNFVQPNTPISLEKTSVSSSASPYLKSLIKDVMIDAVLTVGDTASNGYKMVGLADGTGAYDNNDGTFTMLINHEIGTTLGVPRLHGKKGAFISSWVIDKNTFQVTKGQDLISKVKIWNKVGKKYEDSAAVFNRFCSADLPMISAFYNASTGKGSKERIFMNGEEAGAEGRAFAHVVTGSEAGISYELPRLGKFSFENVLASPIASDNTVVIGTDDATPGQVYVYVGTKTNSGTEIEKAGLTNGKLYGVVVKDLPAEISNTAISPETSFSLVDLGNVTDSTGAQLEAFSTRNLVTKFLRPEDGVWDPTNPNDFYFVTTNNFTSPSRMYRLSFKDATNPALGGAITAVLDGTEGPKMMDNITMDKNGKVYIQEDPGNQDYLASIWKYDVNTNVIQKIAEHDKDRFTTTGGRFLTKDEESSGIIDMEDILGKGHFMLVDQAHYSLDAELVEGGQILHMVSNPDSPYLKSLNKNVFIDDVLTVGDTASNGYKMVGLADGTGAYDNNDGTFTMLINHEIGTTLGVPRLHGKKGAFISSWVIDKNTFQVTKGQDLISKVKIWNKVGKKYEDSAAVFNRFCSADLPMISAFYNASTGKGSKERIFMNGEEAGAEGRAFAHVVTGSEAGISYELPRLGKFSFENVLASPIASDNTVVIGTDDATPGQVYVYVGTKTNSGTEIEKAGLTNGKLYGVVVKDLPAEISNTAISPETSFSLVDLGNVTDSTGAQLEAFSTRNLVTKFLRPEDGVWDPTNPNDFYFVTTNNFTSPSRMYRLSFKDATNPALGGAITAVLDGTEGPKMMDNITMDKNGKVYIQEDPGNQDYLASIWKYDVNTDAIEKIAEHDNDRFTTSGSRFLTKDEESSGIIDMEDILGKGHFMLVDQAHYAIAGETVEGGQILHMVSKDTINNRLVASVSSVNTTICGLKDGSTNVVVNKGVSPYSYNWKVAKTTDANLTNVGAGLDTLVVTDKIGKKIVIPIAINYNTLPNLNVDVIDPTCFGSKGTAEVKMTSELADYSFSWSNSATTLKQELASGSYVVDGKLKLNNNVECKVSSNVKITEPEQLVVETKTSKETDVVGSAVLMVTGGVKPYTYLWSTNSENDTLLGSAGEYTYVVKDANKCIIDGKVTIEKETTSGLSTLTKEFLDLYPNPTNGQVELDWKGEGKVGIQIQSLTGSIMANYNVEGRSKSMLDLSNYAKGTYMIVISSENFNQTIKVIKE